MLMVHKTLSIEQLGYSIVIRKQPQWIIMKMYLCNVLLLLQKCMWYQKFGRLSYFTELSTSLITPLWRMFSLNNETVIRSLWTLDLVTVSLWALDLVTFSLWALDFIGPKSYIYLIYMNSCESKQFSKHISHNLTRKSKKQHSRPVLKKCPLWTRFSRIHNLPMQDQHGSSLWTTQLKNMLYNYNSII